MDEISIIDLIPRYQNEKDDLDKIFKRVVSSGQLILSEENSKLEDEISEYLNVKHCLTLNSGTDALLMALFALGIQKGDEVITSPISFIATIAAIDHVGAVPVLVDVKEDLNIDEDKIEEKITTKTKAIIPVHWTGRMCNMKKINEIAKKHNLKVIEDAAQAIGSSFGKFRPSNLSDIATFSTHPLKILNSLGDGGFVVTNSNEVYEKIKKYRNHGMIGRDDYEFFGVNSRMDSLNAAVVRYRLKKVSDVVRKRNKNIKTYKDLIKTKKFKIHNEEENTINSMTMFVAFAEKRNDLQVFLKENNIQSLIYYGTPLHLQKASRNLNFKRGDFPNAEKYCDQVLTIPFHQYLSKNEIEFISEKINKFYLK